MRRIRKRILKFLIGKKKRADALGALSPWPTIGSVMVSLFIPVLVCVNISSNTHKHSKFFILWLAVFAASIFIRLFIALYGSSQQRLLNRSKTIDEIADSLFINPELLIEWTKENRLSPSFVLKDATLYDENDFNTAKTLLRATSNPEMTEGLLRPATASDNTVSVELLRPVETQVTNSIR